MHELIAKNEDEDIYRRLFENHVPITFRGSKQQEIWALELYTSRIWERPQWVDYDEWDDGVEPTP